MIKISIVQYVGKIIASVPKALREVIIYEGRLPGLGSQVHLGRPSALGSQVHLAPPLHHPPLYQQTPWAATYIHEERHDKVCTPSYVCISPVTDRCHRSDLTADSVHGEIHLQW